MTDYWPNEESNDYDADPVIQYCETGDGSVVAYKGVRSFTTDVAGKLLVMLATTRLGWGMALKTQATTGKPVPVLLRGIIKLVSAGSTRNYAQYFDTNGELLDLADQAVNEAGASTYTIYYTAKVARALQTIADNSEGLYYFNP